MLKPEVGKTYIDRDGREVTIVSENGRGRAASTYKFVGHYPNKERADSTLSGEGKFLYGGRDDLDLISEKLPEATAETKPKTNRHAELIKAWADGAVIQGTVNGTDWQDFGAPGSHNDPSWFADFEYRLKPEEPQFWNHLFSIGFSVISFSEDPDSVSSSELRAALTERISDLDNDGSMYEACSYCGDTYPTETK